MAQTALIVPIRVEPDIVSARQAGRELAAELGFSRTEQTLVATAISEIARNILTHAVAGEVCIRRVESGAGYGVEVVCRDEGPGIADVEQAMQDGFSTAGSLGLGLPGARRLMDEFGIESAPGRGTTITMRKWPR